MPYNHLTKKQELFCLRYFELGNASEAARLAGYALKNVGFHASQVLNSPLVKARLNDLRQMEEYIREKSEMEAVMSVLERKQVLTEIARADLTKFVNEKGDIDLSGENTGVISELQVEEWRGDKDGSAQSRTKRLKIHSKIQSIDLLNKMDKLYAEGAVVQTNISRQVNIYVIDNETKDLLARIGERTRLLANGHENHQSIQGHSGSVGSGQETD